MCDFLSCNSLIASTIIYFHLDPINMVLFSTLTSTLIGAVLVSAQQTPNTPLTKPALRPQTHSFTKGYLEHLPQTNFTIKSTWPPGWIPQGCKDIAEGKISKDVNFNPKDVRVFNVEYDDVSTDSLPFQQLRREAILTYTLVQGWPLGILSSQRCTYHY